VQLVTAGAAARVCALFSRSTRLGRSKASPNSRSRSRARLAMAGWQRHFDQLHSCWTAVCLQACSQAPSMLLGVHWQQWNDQCPFYGQCCSAGRLTEKGTALEQQAWHSDRPQAWAVDGVKQLSSSSSHPNQRLLLPEQMLRCRARAGDQASTGAEQEQDTCLQIVSCCGQCALPVLMRCSECVGVCVCARMCCCRRRSVRGVPTSCLMCLPSTQRPSR
jgi:hypothetical protein